MAEHSIENAWDSLYKSFTIYGQAVLIDYARFRNHNGIAIICRLRRTNVYLLYGLQSRNTLNDVNDE